MAIIAKADRTPNDMTLAKHAEAWWREQDKRVPRKGSKAYLRMYECWIAFAFQGFAQ